VEEVSSGPFNPCNPCKSGRRWGPLCTYLVSLPLGLQLERGSLCAHSVVSEPLGDEHPLGAEMPSLTRYKMIPPRPKMGTRRALSDAVRSENEREKMVSEERDKTPVARSPWQSIGLSRYTSYEPQPTAYLLIAHTIHLLSPIRATS
jgi:hypothetical protein